MNDEEHLAMYQGILKTLTHFFTFTWIAQGIYFVLTLIKQAEVCGEYEMTYWVNDEGKITVTQTSTWKGAPRPPVPKSEDPMALPTYAFLGDDTEHECPLCKDDEVFQSAKRNCQAFMFGRPLKKMAPQLMFIDWVRRFET